MKKLATMGLLTLGFFLAGCGATTPPATTTAGGNWEATLVGPPANETVFNFIATFSVNGNGALNVSVLNFITTGPCFPVAGETVGGSFNVTSAESNPAATANVTFNVEGGNDKLALTGIATGVTNTTTLATTWNAITGTWQVTGGANCTGSGTFTMCPNAKACSTT
ncbi:MAG TPA: hypothetical protein VKR60_00045 [Candidatus Sulfotelmatobacter sp.]|nr:hypothetical protein [Candidatus Sulfotelmatobacter sp.]